MSLEEKVGQALEDAGLETVPQNLFGVNPVERKRPYLGDLASREQYMKFMGYERGVLTARIAELNSRAEQILYIYLCRVNEAYLAVVDKSMSTQRPDDAYFYDWLDELSVQGIAYAGKRLVHGPSGNRPIYQWDDIQKTLEVCLNKGLDIETAAKVASVGVRAVEKYLKHGIISLDDKQESRYVGRDTALPTGEAVEDLPDEIERDRQADILRELADATSSRGASILARDRIGTDFVRISAINREKESELPGWIRYSIEAQLVKKNDLNEYTPYECRMYFQDDTPIQVIKFTLTKLSEALSRIL